MPDHGQHIPIGSGTSSEVFGLSGGRVLKLFRRHVPARLVEREAAVSAHAAGAGLPTARLLGQEVRDGRMGLIYEYVPGRTLLAAVRYQLAGSLLALRRLAQLQARVHDVPAPEGLRRQREAIERQIAQGATGGDARAAALVALRRLPDGDRLCHGDLHPGNAIVRPDGELVLLDWCKAAAGHPAADAARAELLIRFAGYGRRDRLRDRALDAVRDLLGLWYTHCYARAAGIAVAEVRAWRLPLAVAWAEGHRTTRSAAFRAFVDREAAAILELRPVSAAVRWLATARIATTLGVIVFAA